MKNEASYRVKKERFILHTIKLRSAIWIYINLNKIVLVNHVIDGKTEEKIKVTGRRGRILMQLLDELKEKREFCILKEEALDRSHRRTWFGGGYGSVVRLGNERTKGKANEWRKELITRGG